MGTTIELVHDRFFTGVICCDVNPTDKNAFRRIMMKIRNRGQKIETNIRRLLWIENVLV
jgi:hypothetical protein